MRKPDFNNQRSLDMPRVKKPTAIKIAEGNPGKRKIDAKSEPQPNKTIPSMPDWMDAEASKEWNRISGHLHECGLLTQIDMEALAIYCQLWSRWVSLEMAIKTEGFTVIDSSDNQKINPKILAANTTANLIHKYLTQFGMTPSSRAGLHIKQPEGQKEEDDLWTQFNKMTEERRQKRLNQ
jgi:P27 family predicted phage terminase small subunit